MYSEQFQKSLALVEAARAKNLAMEPTRMTAEQKEAVLSAFHPDYREDQFEALKIGPNAGDRVPHELADMLQAHSRITSDSVDLTKPDYDTDVLIIGGGGAGTAAAIEAHRAGASVMDGLHPTRLLHPWDFPGKSTGVGCHCLLRYM